MRAADGINQFTWVAYQRRNPYKIFDRFNDQRQPDGLDWDYGGNFLGASFNVNGNAQFRNKYQALAFQRQPAKDDNVFQHASCVAARHRNGLAIGPVRRQVKHRSSQAGLLSTFGTFARSKVMKAASTDRSKPGAASSGGPRMPSDFPSRRRSSESEREMQYIDTLARFAIWATVSSSAPSTRKPRSSTCASTIRSRPTSPSSFTSRPSSRPAATRRSSASPTPGPPPIEIASASSTPARSPTIRKTTPSRSMRPPTAASIIGWATPTSTSASSTPTWSSAGSTVPARRSSWCGRSSATSQRWCRATSAMGVSSISCSRRRRRMWCCSR